MKPLRLRLVLPFVLAGGVGIFLAIAGDALNWDGTTTAVVGGSLILLLVTLGTPLALLPLAKRRHLHLHPFSEWFSQEMESAPWSDEHPWPSWSSLRRIDVDRLDSGEAQIRWVQALSSGDTVNFVARVRFLGAVVEAPELGDAELISFVTPLRNLGAVRTREVLGAAR